MPFLGTTGGGSVKQYGGLANLGYFIKNSLRFRSSASAYLNRTPASSGSRTTTTQSIWVKRGQLGTAQRLITARASTTDDTTLWAVIFSSGDKLQVSGSLTLFRTSTQVFRDPAAWYHIVTTIDTTNATAANRLRIWVNNVEITAWDTNNEITQNLTTALNNTVGHWLGSENGTDTFFDGYMAEVNWIDGQALTPSSFGKTDAVTGQWIPKKFAGTYGTNGFYLKFADASAATAAAIGKDSSPNGNNWTPNNISVTADRTYDPVTDVPTISSAASNYATFNPLMTGAGVTVSQGNLFTNHNNGTSGWVSTAVTQAMPSTGKWYIEMTVVTYLNGYTGYGFYRDSSTNLVGNGAATGANNPNWWSHYGHVTAFYNNSAESGSAATWNSGTMMLAFDADAGGKAYFGRNGTWYNSSDPAAGTNAPFTISRSLGQNVYFIVEGYNNIQWAVNAGQQTFAYTPPSGFKSLNTFNLP
jgi:hypothetical protein